jgi:nicotinic acid mononucleotide adenylyltransferase
MSQVMRQLEAESITYNSSIDSCEKVRQWMQVRELLQQMQYVSFMREDSAAEAGARIASADAAARGRSGLCKTNIIAPTLLRSTEDFCGS